MSFLETVEKARAFLERNGRVSLRALRREFALDADGVTLSDTWPAGFARGTVATTQGERDTTTSPDDFTCDLGTVESGDSVTLTVDYTVPSDTAWKLSSGGTNSPPANTWI